MDKKRVADYFIIAGLPSQPAKQTLLDESSLEVNLKPSHNQVNLDECSLEVNLKPSRNQVSLDESSLEVNL